MATMGYIFHSEHTYTHHMFVNIVVYIPTGNLTTNMCMTLLKNLKLDLKN